MKMHSNKIALAIIASMVMACSDSDEKQISKEELLTANSSKDWNVSYATYDLGEPDESCKAVSIVSADNTWIFKTKGDFEFNNGTIREMPDCEECNCSDFANLVGKWTIFSNEDSISVVATGVIEEDGGITQLDQHELLRSKIKSITATEMVLGGNLEFTRFKAK